MPKPVNDGAISSRSAGRKRSRMAGSAQRPAWADGLRKLYDGVVAEPLPDSFEDLLKKLDQAKDG
jgi:hypothetical protein